MESLLRFGIFLTVLALMLSWEKLRPFRRYPQPKSERFLINLGLTFANFLVLRVFAGGGAVLAADYAKRQEIGLLNHLEFAHPVEAAAAMLILDFAIYLQHRLMHKIPFLWRFHKVHHCDPGFDTTTAVRFHPLEILFSMYYKMALILLLGASLEAVLLFEIILNACALFNHGNVRIPEPWDARIRVFLITPDMHRIHHSTSISESNSNFGFSVPWWDWLGHSYLRQAELAQVAMHIGILDPLPPEGPGFFDLIRLPFANLKTKSNVNTSTSSRERIK